VDLIGLARDRAALVRLFENGNYSLECYEYLNGTLRNNTHESK
jgi:hypothetical protein